MKFKDAIEEVRNRVNIVDLIGQYVRLKRIGNNYSGLCPFHNEKTPSFSVSETKQIFKCFGCGKGGNVYTFLQEYDGMTFPEAVKFLAAKVNITIDDEYKTNNEDIKKKEFLYKLYKDVANAYYINLFTDNGRVGLEYFINRKLTKETIKKFGLGYAPKSYGYIYDLMKKKGYEDKILMESKLFGINDKGAYDFFYERVMFPLVDMHNNVVSFQGRILGSGDQKYINTQGSLIYNKSKHLFGVNYAKMTKNDYYILCEGNMDVITLHQAGFDSAVASWGTAFTKEQALLIKKKVQKVILSQDTDNAGLKAIESSYEICEEAGIKTYAIDLSPVKDADEFIIKYGKEAFQKKIDNAIPTLMFIISKLRNKYDLNETYEYEKYINDIVTKLSKFDNSLIREKYIKDVAEQEKLSLANLQKQVDKYLGAHSNTMPNNILYKAVASKNDDISQNNKVEEQFVNLLLSNPNAKNKITEYISVDELNDKSSKYIYEKYLEGYDTNRIIDALVEFSDDEAKKIKDIVFTENQVNDKNFDIAMTELIKKIKINNINTKSVDSLEEKLERNQQIKNIKEMQIKF